jgi:dienelactone hydrolase
LTSKPPAACCSTGHEHTGTPTGTLIQLPNTTISAYVAKPPSTATAHPTKAILFVPDILGLHKNNQLLADRFASEGNYLTLLVDPFNGDPFPLTKPFAILSPNDDLTQDWVAHGTDGKNPHTIKEIDPIVKSAITYLRSTGITRIGAVGYCVGVKYFIRFLDAGKDKIDVGFGAHPSYVTDEELWAARGPLSIAAAGERDLIFTDELRRHTEEILRKKGEIWSITLYSGVAHGFAVRGDPEGVEDRWAMDEAFKQAVRFFDSWL